MKVSSFLTTRLTPAYFVASLALKLPAARADPLAGIADADGNTQISAYFLRPASLFDNETRAALKYGWDVENAKRRRRVAAGVRGLESRGAGRGFSQTEADIQGCRRSIK